MNISLSNTEKQMVLQKRKTRKNKNNRRRRDNHRRQHVDDLNTAISPIKNKPKITRCMRYVFNDTGIPVILYSTDLSRWCGFVTNTATTFYQTTQTIRLLRVGLTLLSNSSTGACSLSFQWLGSNSPSDMSIMYASQGVPSRRSFYPPDDSLSAFWWDNATAATALCSIDAQYVTSEPVVYVDLEFEYVQASGTVTNHALVGAATFTGIGYRTMFQDTCTPVGVDSVT